MRIIKRLHTLERLEHRSLLAGDCTVTVSGGDLIIRGDALANQIEIRQISAGNYEITGQDGTLINGAPSFLAKRVNDDFRIEMAQGGSDSVKLLGALRVPDRLDVVMGDGNLQILGTTGIVRVGGVVDIHRASPDVFFELTIRDQVQFDRKVTLTGCESVFIESRGQLTGPTFNDPLVIMSCDFLQIESFDQSVGPRFKKSVTLGAGPPTDSFDVNIASNGDSIGPRFDGSVNMILGESIRIESNDTSTGPRFDGSVNLWAAVNVIVQSHHSSDGLQFRGPVTFHAADDVFITSGDQSQGATFYGKATFDAGVSVVVVSSDDSVGPVFKGNVGMTTDQDVLIWSRNNSVGPTFRQPVNITVAENRAPSIRALPPTVACISAKRAEPVAPATRWIDRFSPAVMYRGARKLGPAATLKIELMSTVVPALIRTVA